MNKSRKILFAILLILLVISFILLLITNSQKKALQKDIDFVFTNAISDSMGGLSRDYSKLNYDEKVQLYYQTVSNLDDAMETFHLTSYKEYDGMFQALNKLYIYLLKNKNDDYEVDNTLHIVEFLGKVVVFPEDDKLISDFNDFLDEKEKQ